MNGYEKLPICSAALERGYGYVRDLKMSQPEIRSLELQGFIKNAVSSDGDTWKLTQKGRDTRDFFLNRSNRSYSTRTADWICRHILRLRADI